MEERIKYLREICDNYDDMIVFGDEQDYEGGEIDAFYDATEMLERFWNRVASGEDKSVLVLDLNKLKQKILLDPADYDHLTGAWVAMKIKDKEGNNMPVKKLFEEIFTQLEKQIEE